MKTKSTLRTFLALAGSSLLAITCASAGTYYWDSDGDGTAGFGSTPGTWDAAGTGNLWSTSPTGDGVGGAAVADYATTTADDLFFGTSFTGDVPPLYPFSGAITINGTVNAKSIFCSEPTPAFVAGASPVLNFPAEGRFEHASEGTIVLPVMTITGAVTSMTWKAGFIDNLSIVKIINNAAKNIIEGSGSFIAVDDGVELGPDGTPFVFNGGGLRMIAPFYTSMSAFNAAHPITINPNVDIGFDPRGIAFTVDVSLNEIGTGKLFAAGQNASSPLILTLPSTRTGGTYVVAGFLQISDNDQLGDITGPLVFGSGPTGTGEGSNGTLRITGTTMTSLGARPLVHTPDKGMGFDIADVLNTFTVDQSLNQGAGGFSKYGAGSLIINTTSTYTGLTSVLGGKLSFAIPAALPSGAVTVNGADAVLDLGAYNPSVTTVTLTNGSVIGSGTLTGTSFVLNGTGSANIAIGVKLAGSGAMAKNSTGTATLSGDNSAYSGTVTISKGTMLVNNTAGSGTGAGNVNVTAGTLGGTGSISGAVTIGNSSGSADAILAPGTSIESLNTGNLTFNSDGSYAVELDGTSVTSDVTNVTGAVSINASTTLTVNVTGTLSVGQQYVIVSNDDVDAVTGTFSGFAQDAVVGNFGGIDLKISYTGGDGNDIVLYAVSSATAYQTWATGSEPFDGDANGDGVKDGLAFLLGAATPATDATSLLPTTSQTGGNLVMNFTCLATAERGTATLNLEYDGDLAGTWLSVPVPGAVGVPNPIDETTATGSVSFVATDGGTNVNGDALIDVEATISDASESASSKLFGRLKAEEN